MNLQFDMSLMYSDLCLVPILCIWTHAVHAIQRYMCTITWSTTQHAIRPPKPASSYSTALTHTNWATHKISIGIALLLGWISKDLQKDMWCWFYKPWLVNSRSRCVDVQINIQYCECGRRQEEESGELQRALIAPRPRISEAHRVIPYNSTPWRWLMPGHYFA